MLNNIEKNSAQADKKAAEQQPEIEGVKKGEPLRMSFKKLAITGVTVNAIVPVSIFMFRVPGISVRNLSREGFFSVEIFSVNSCK